MVDVSSFYCLKSRVFRLYFNGKLHLVLDMREYVGMQSWYDEERGKFKYCVEYYGRGGNVLSEYQDKELWRGVLVEVEKMVLVHFGVVNEKC